MCEGWGFPRERERDVGYGDKMEFSSKKILLMAVKRKVGAENKISLSLSVPFLRPFQLWAQGYSPGSPGAGPPLSITLAFDDK